MRREIRSSWSCLCFTVFQIGEHKSWETISIKRGRINLARLSLYVKGAWERVEKACATGSLFAGWRGDRGKRTAVDCPLRDWQGKLAYGDQQTFLHHMSPGFCLPTLFLQQKIWRYTICKGIYCNNIIHECWGIATCNRDK